MANESSESLTAEQLRKAMVYDHSTGMFYKPTAAGGKKILGSIKKDGYIMIFAGGKQRPAHRLAWLYVHGRWPSGVVDHIDGNRMHNRIENLRDVSIQQNCENRRQIHKGKKSSTHLGVHFYKRVRSRPWTAQITIKGERVYLGRFDTEEEAAAAYEKAAAELKSKP